MTFWKNKHVLVPGGTGLIGAPIVTQLLERGAKVRVASLDSSSRCPEGADFLQLDLTDKENCLHACDGIDFVFDMLGTKASPETTRNHPASHFVTNMQLQLPFLEAARIQKVPGLLFASSIGVYGTSEVMHEDDVWQTFPSPNDWFGGWAKRMGELQIEGYRKEYGWNKLTIVRPANVYGPGDCFEGSHAMVVPSLIRRAIEASEGDGRLMVWGDGSPRRDFVFSTDVARMCIAVAEANPQQPINLGSGNARSIRELAEIVVACVDSDLELVWDTEKPSGDLLRCLDVSRARSHGIEATTSLEEGIRQTVEWFKSHRNEHETKHNAYAERSEQ